MIQEKVNKFNNSLNKHVAFRGSTYDTVQGWVIWGEIKEHYMDGGEFLVEKTNDGRHFEPFPSMPRNFTSYGIVCMESLNNGGDIFAIEDGWREGKTHILTHIFRASSSTWERQSDFDSFLLGSAGLYGKF